MSESPTLILYGLKEPELRSFRNACMKSKMILNRYKGRFIGISKEVERVTPEKIEKADTCYGVLEFVNSSEAHKFLYSERVFSQLDCFDCHYCWSIPMNSQIEISTQGSPTSPQLMPPQQETTLMFIEIANQSDLDRFPGIEEEFNISQFQGRPNISHTSEISRVQGNKTPAHFRVTQWPSKGDFMKWCQSDNGPQLSMMASMAKIYLAVFKSDF